MKKIFFIICLTSFSGCASDVSQPRMQLGAVAMPTCTFLCQISIQLNDVEGAKIQAKGASNFTETNTAGAMSPNQSGGGLSGKSGGN